MIFPDSGLYSYSINTVVIPPTLKLWTKLDSKRATRSIIEGKAESNRLTNNDETRRLYSRRPAPRGRQR